MNDARRQKCQMRKDKIKTGWKLSDHKGPRVPHLVPRCQMHGNQKGGGGRVSINNSWQWHNGKEREKDGGRDLHGVSDVDPCPPRPLGGEKKKEKRRRAPWGRVRTRNEKNNHHIYNNFISYFKKQNQNHSTQGFPRGPPPWY